MSRLQSRRGRPSNYVKQLRSPQWREVCRMVRLRDGHSCVSCGKTYQLEIHHKTYYVNGKSIVGKEMEHLDCLITLCADCHKNTHNNALQQGNQ